MKAWLRGSLALGSATLFVSSCVLVENFEGYEPLGSAGSGGRACDNSFCPDASSSSSSGSTGIGGAGGSGSSSSGSSTGGSGGGGPTRCAKIACNSLPCSPEVLVPNSQGGLIAVDSNSLFIRTELPHRALRVAKPGCSVLAFDELIGYSIPDQGFVSNGFYAAWLEIDPSGTCSTPALTYCDPTACKTQKVPVPAMWADQGPLARLALGPDHLYFTMRNGLVGRVAIGSTQLEELWTDPADQSGPMKRGYLRYPTFADGKIAVVREFIEDAGMNACAGGTASNTGAILLSDATPGAVPQLIAQNLNFPGAVAISQNYVYFTVLDSAKILNRVPKSGGAVETLAPEGKITATFALGIIHVHKGWVYFRVGMPDGKEGIARMPAETANFAMNDVEIVVESPGFRSFYVDDDALYWDECVDEMCGSGTYRILARVLTP